MDSIEEKVYLVSEVLEREGRLSRERRIPHHKTTVYNHSVHVAVMSVQIARKLGCPIDEYKLIRGALLHDYFLYNWRTDKSYGHLHGLKHPKIALKNAREDFNLTQEEENMILRHMFPLTPIPPKNAGAWIICLADKICAVKELSNARHRPAIPVKDGEQTI